MQEILLILHQKENCRLLIEFLGNRYSISVFDNVKSLNDSFDLCLLDGFSLTKYYEHLQQRKQSEQPVFLPILLLTSRQNVKVLTHNLWQLVDDVVVTPIEKIELLCRVEMMVRSRLFSLQLRSAIEQERCLKQELESVNRQLSYLASVDGLTKVANRRCFDEVLTQEWKRSIREQTPLFLILCDVDFFKAYNDTYGHQGGDECLQWVANVLQQVIRRPADMVARYGGEEFGIILPNTSVRGALYIAQNIKEQLQSLAIPHQASPISSYVTISFGVAGWVPTPQTSVTHLIRAADQALYEAKLGGRDRIVLKDCFYLNE